MEGGLRNIGIDILDDVPWGTHFCLFYKTKAELIEVLVPYFKAGLENNEYCMWVTSDLFTTEDAENALQQAIPDFKKYLKKRQIEIIPSNQWYFIDGCFNAQQILDGWIEKLESALARGFAGLRITGDTFGVDKLKWDSFAKYEAEVNDIIDNYQIIAICAYYLDKCGPYELVDVINNHQFTMLKYAEQWTELKNYEQIKVEQQFRESEENYRTLFESSADGIVSTDLQGDILDVNQAFIDMIGYSKAELVQMAVMQITPAKWHARELEIINSRLLSGNEQDIVFEKEYIRKDGSIVPISLRLWPIRDETGQPKKTWGIVRDITEVKQLAAERARLQVEKLDSLNTLAGGIAHDFNNILACVMSNIYLAKKHVVSESKAAVMLEEAEKASTRAKDLTQQLLTFAKGGLPVKKPLCMGELIKDTAIFALGDSKVKLAFSISDDLWTVAADAGQMDQVISNLIINADEAMPGGGMLNVKVKNTVFKKNNWVRVTIADHGFGIAREHLDKIFEPYFTTKKTGNGLGLATTYSIIKNHDGYIKVNSVPDVGTTFHIYLPAASGEPKL